MGVGLARTDGRVVTDERKNQKDGGAWETVLAVGGFGGQLAIAPRCFWPGREGRVPAGEGED